MTGNELRDLLGSLGISQAEFARLLDVTPRTVALWMVGTPETVPGPAVAYVRLLAALSPESRQAEINRVKGPVVTLTDGIYAVEFQGVKGAGYGTIVLDGGLIYGADIAGGRYDGVYSTDPNTGMVNAFLKLFFPRNVESVFGESHTFDWNVDATAQLNARIGNEQGVTRLHLPLGRWVNVAYRFLRALPSRPIRS